MAVADSGSSVTPEAGPGPSEAGSEPFDVCGPLPGPGVTVLQASAGTGKTFTIAALVTRLVAEGVPVSDILAVTFTRMATGELRDRVRARLVAAEEALGRWLAAGEVPADDVLRLLVAGPVDEVEVRRQRLADALTAFDEATITTTHGFCQLVLDGLGVAGEVPAGATLLEDPRQLVEEVVDDLYVRWALHHGVVPPFTRSEAVDIAREAVANPGTALQPARGDDAGGLRRRLADGVRAEVARRLRDANLLTFDDLLVRLRRTLTDDRRGPAACARLRDRYPVVLVDEFQDTDPIQWDVVRTAFGDGTTRLVLIGDPKQAIYAFRGADVHAYLQAATMADRRFTLGENWRSDADLLQACDALLAGAALGHPGIAHRPVRAAAAARDGGLHGAPVAAPLRARVVHAGEHGLPVTRYGDAVKAVALDWVAGDLAADVVRLLRSGATLGSRSGPSRSVGPGDGPGRPVAPGDVAVLVGTNRQAGIVQRALRGAGVPAVVAGTGSVLATAAAGDWLCLLQAIEQPASWSRTAALALSGFVGMAAGEVAAADEAVWEDLHAKVHRWGEVLRRHGVASLFRTVLAGEALPRRLLAAQQGERRLTDLGHVAQLLHAEATRAQLGAPALRAWLARRMQDAETGREGAEAEERSRWLDSDAEAVQVLTVHRAKGLEFPVVYCPYLWDQRMARKGGPVVFHDRADGVRTLDVGGLGGAGYDEHFRLQRDEERGEDLRELYVALTRARHQAILWWVRVKDCQHSPLGRLLLSKADDGTVATSGGRAPKDEEVWDRLQAVATGAAAGKIAVERATGPDPDQQWEGRGAPAAAALVVASFDRPLDLRWRRTSYSKMTAAAHSSAVVTSEPEEDGTTDEPADGAGSGVVRGVAVGGASGGPQDAALAPATDEALLQAVPSSWDGVPGGVEVGTFVHRVLERVDFAAADLRAAVRGAVEGQRSRHDLSTSAAAAVVDGLVAALATPLGALAGGVALRHVRRGDRVDEMAFELPVAGGDHPAAGRAVGTAAIGEVLARHERPGGPLAGYGVKLAAPLLAAEARGYLTGSLDLVFRQAAADGTPRFFVVDYKTNRLGPAGEALTAWQYRPAALDEEMQRMHYPLQAVFYTVALHRYLRWRLPGYAPEVHLGGVLYLFVRGMLGPDAPTVGAEPCGVFSWRPPTALVAELSDLFGAGA